MATPLSTEDSPLRPQHLTASRRESCLSDEQDPSFAQRTRCCFDAEQLTRGFLESYKNSYGYPGVQGLDFDAFRQEEFPQLQGRAYLDYAGAAPVSQSQLKAAFSTLSSTLFTNPHTHGDLSLSTNTAEAIGDLRLQVLGLLNANPQEYCCIFTSGATAGMQIIAHSFPWQQGSQFAYTLENHNSVLGIRESALASGASATALEVQECPHVENRRATSACDNTASTCDCASALGRTPASETNSSCLCDASSTGASSTSSGRGSDARLDEMSVGSHWCASKCVREEGTVHGCSDAGVFTVRGHMCASDTRQEQRLPPGWQNHVQHQQEQGQWQLQQHEQGQEHGQEQEQGQDHLRQEDEQRKREREQPQEHSKGREKEGARVPCLFAMPAECNFSGRKLDLCLVRRIQTGALELPRGCLGCTCSPHFAHYEKDGGERNSPQNSADDWEGEISLQDSASGQGRGQSSPQTSPSDRQGDGTGERWFVLLDAAKACSTSPPDLSLYPADFVTLSFYKIFGYPSGLGALVARKEALRCLKKRYFGGGTVSASAAESAFFQPKESLEEWFEDGTPPFLDIVASLPPGLALLNRLGFPAISRHSLSLAAFTAQCLVSLTHHNGTPVCQLYSRYSSIRPSPPKASTPAKVHPCDADRAPGALGTCASSISSTPASASAPDAQPCNACKSLPGASEAFPCTSCLDIPRAPCLCGQCYRGPGPKERKPGPEVSTATARCCAGTDQGSSLPSSDGDETIVGPTVTSGFSEEARQGRAVTPRFLEGGQHGPTVTFNLRRADGSYVGHREVAKMAELHSIVLRTGSFCNPGASTMYLGVSLEDRLALAEGGGACWDDHDLVDGRPMGAVRASFGYASSLDDALALLRLVHGCFVEGPSPDKISAGEPSLVEGPILTEPCAKGPSVQRPPCVEERLRKEPCVEGTLHTECCSEGSSIIPGSHGKELEGGPTGTESSREVSSSVESRGEYLSRTEGPEAEGPQQREVLGEGGGRCHQDEEGIGDQFYDCEEVFHDFKEKPDGLIAGTTSALHPVLDSPSPPSPHSQSRSRSQEQAPAIPSLPISPQLPSGRYTPGRRRVLIESLYLYPIKSCGAMEVTRWPLGSNGLLYDREWVLVDAAGAPLKSRRHPGMYLLRPSIDLEARTLTVTSPGMEAPLIVTLGPGQRLNEGQGQGQGQQLGFREAQDHGQGARQRQGEGEGGVGSGSEGEGEPMVHQVGLTLCGDRVAGLRYARGEVSAWLSRALGVPCSLVRQVSGARCMKRPSVNPGVQQAPASTAQPQVPTTTVQPQIPTSTVQPQVATTTTTTVRPPVPTTTVRHSQQVPTQSVQQEQKLSQAQTGRQSLPESGSNDKGPLDSLGFANEGQFLFVSRASVDDLNRRLLQSHSQVLEETKGALGEGKKGDQDKDAGDKGSKGEKGTTGAGHGEAGRGPLQVCPLRFRPNVVVSGPGLRPFEEEHWKTLHLQARGDPGVYQGHAIPAGYQGHAAPGEVGRCQVSGNGVLVGPRSATSAQWQDVALVSRGGCSRCAMVNLDPNTGGSSGLEPLRTLSQYRREKSKIMFGVLFGRDTAGTLGSVGEASFGVGDVLEIEE